MKKVTDSIIKKAKKLKLIARIGIGVDNLNLDLLKKKKLSLPILLIHNQKVLLNSLLD